MKQQTMPDFVKSKLKKKTTQEIIKEIGILFKQNGLKNHVQFIQDLHNQIYEINKPLNIILCLIANYGNCPQSYDFKFLKPLQNLLLQLKTIEEI